MLQAAGIDYATYFSSYFFLGSHPRVTDALVAGSIDAGATWDFNLEEARRKHGDVFRVLHEERIPNLSIATHPSLGEARSKLVREALLSADPALFEGLPTAGYVTRPESFYDGVRRLLPAKPAADTKAP
jgi:phosphonate transport system substrate-binding protein